MHASGSKTEKVTAAPSRDKKKKEGERGGEIISGK